MSPKTSKLCLEIHLPTEEGSPVEFIPAEEESWEYDPGTPPDTYRTAALWEQCKHDWPNRQGILNQAGATFGQWLFDVKTVHFLTDAITKWSESAPRLRIEFYVPPQFAEYAWEIAALEGIGALAVHQALTVVRIRNTGAQQHLPPTGQIISHIIAVGHHPTQEWPALQTDQEAEVIRQEIEQANPSQFSVEVDFLGNWESLVKEYEHTGPPHIFHFAGHGLEDAKGLVFRAKKDGNPKEVAAEQLALLLTNRVKNRQTHLVFLNACTSAADGQGAYQPFGGLGDLLTQHGVPMVVGLQTPITDQEASTLARAFYAEISRGVTVDCAVQEARRQLFLLGSSGVGWGFFSLKLVGQPVPVYTPATTSNLQPSANFWRFGHKAQRDGVELFLNRKTPIVVVVHGEERSGQRHVLERVQHDLVREGNILWRPIVALHLQQAGDPLLLRSQLCGGLARALAIDGGGPQDQLEERLAKTIADRCGEERTLVIDLQEVLKFRDEAQARSVLTLIQDLWPDLMEKAAAYSSRLPVFLLVSLAYPRRQDNHPQAAKIEESIRVTQHALSTLQEKSRLKGKVRVEVLPPLEPFDTNYVAGFLEAVLELDPESAETKADFLVDLNDNETILERLKTFLSDLEQA